MTSAITSSAFGTTTSQPGEKSPFGIVQARPKNFLPISERPQSLRPVADQYRPRFVAPNLRKQPEGKKNESLSKKAWSLFILSGPIMGFIGSLALVGKSLPAGGKKKVVNQALSLMKQKARNINGLDQKLEATGQRFLGLSGVVRSLSGISAGIVSGQPSMILGNVIQIFPETFLALPKRMLKRFNTEGIRTKVTNLEMLLGGVFTVGFANELKNKDERTPKDQIRRYDMSRLKAVFKPHSGLSGSERATGFFKESGKLIAFSAKDHMLIFRDLYRLATQKNEPTPQAQSKKEQFKAWVKRPSAEKSQLSALFFYLGSLPIILLELTNKMPKTPWVLRSLSGIKMLGMIIANLAPFAIALNRDDARGKAPLLGAPLAVIGMSLAGFNKLDKNMPNSRLDDFLVGVGHLGDSGNELFFSEVATKGVKTKS